MWSFILEEFFSSYFVVKNFVCNFVGKGMQFYAFYGKFMNIYSFCILIYSCASVFILSGCARGGSDTDSSSGEALPPHIESMPDTAKARVMLDAGVSPDSLASFVVNCVDGKHQGITFSEFDAVENYVAERLGESALDTYDVSFEASLQALPLDKKYKVVRETKMVDEPLIGYTLGLEYVNRVVDNSLSIGKVDLEVAELKRACNSDESVYNDFLVGFAAGISHTPADLLPQEVTDKYGQTKETSPVPKVSYFE